MTGQSTRAEMKTYRSVLIAAGIVALTWMVFSQTLHHQFINYDDPLYVIDNAHVRAGLTWHGIAWAFTHVHSQNWHPLTTMSHMLDCQLFGLNPGAHHLVNVFLHSIAALLLFIFLQQTTARVWLSAFVAAAFAIHPLRVESVAWIAERKDVLSGVFFMLTLIAYARYVRAPSASRYVAMSILFACGLMSKPMLVTTPFVLLLLDYWPLQRFERSTTEPAGAERRGREGPRGLTSGDASQSITKLLIEKLPLFALVAGSVMMTLWAQNFALGSTEYLPLQWRISNAVFSYFEYIRQTFWPHNLIPFYVHPENRLETWRLVIAAAILILISAVAFVRRRQNPYLIVGWLWYLVMLIPVIGIVQVGLQGHADRYTYLPQIGLLVAIAWSLWDLTRALSAQKILLSGAAIIAIATLSILSWKQTRHWRDTETLWRHTLAVTPESDVAHAGLGGILFVRGQIEEAIQQYESALRLRGGNTAAHFGLGRALAAKQKTDAAIFHFEKALEIQPDYIGASNDLGIAFASKGELGRAIEAWRQTLAFDPDNADALNNIAWVRATAADAQLRDGREALVFAERAVKSGGENPVALRTLAAAQAENGQFQDAVSTCSRAEELANKNGDTAMAKNLHGCVESFRRGEPLHITQGSR
jgi:tetratricopeptide (TPR) repeat protein